jgi:hypothetical protein
MAANYNWIPVTCNFRKFTEMYQTVNGTVEAKFTAHVCSESVTIFFVPWGCGFDFEASASVKAPWPDALILVHMRYCMSASYPTLLNYGLACFAQDQRSQVLKDARSVQLSARVTVKFLCFGATAPQWDRASSFLMFLDHTRRRSTVGRTPLDEWSTRRRDLYLTTHNTHKRQTSMPPVGFEPAISAGERPQTHTLHSATTGVGLF